MRVLIDTNILLMALPSKSTYNLFIQKFNTRKYELVLTTEIFLEYEEILKTKSNAFITANILNALIEAPNIFPADVFYKWNLITADPDDNKFTDAYIASNADYLVTNDAHFNEVKKINFPKVNIVSADEFLQIVKSLPDE